MQKHWESIIERTDTTKVEKATAPDQHLTSIIMDLLRQFEKVQKYCQKFMITSMYRALKKKESQMRLP
jgi:hypothetical protein